MLFRLRLTPKGRLRRNVVILLLIPLVLLLTFRPCFTHQAALEQLQTGAAPENLSLRPRGRGPVVSGGAYLRPPL